MKTYKFKLYNHKRNKHLHHQINIASNIYNHCIALHKRYYRRFNKHLYIYQLQKHITKLKKLPKYTCWNNLGSQAIIDITGRIDKGYKLFFRNLKANIITAPPSFKKCHKYKSFTLRQCNGYKLIDNTNQIKIGKYIYRYFKHREIKGNIKTVTIKRDSLGDIYIYITTDTVQVLNSPRSGKSVGFDFGLKIFLTASDNNNIESPLFFKHGITEIRKASRQLSKKQRGSNNRHKTHLNLARKHKKIVNQRSDFQWKLANQITNKYDYLFFEDLNLREMQKLYGKKINDLGFASFLQKVDYYVKQKDKKIIKIDRFYSSSKTCSICNTINQNLKLHQREWTCTGCNTTHDRDKNASQNILRVGASTLGLDNIRPSMMAVAA